MYTPSAEEIKKLREATFAPMIQCKEALVQSEGDFKKAVSWLNEKGLTKAASKSERITGAGVIDSYIHNGSQIGVLLDIRCETDFVAKTDEFKKLSHDLCLQIASMNPSWVSKEDVPEETISVQKAGWEKELVEAKKPKEMFDKIIQGKLEAFYKENCLLNQVFIKDEAGTLTVGELIAQTIAKTGENVKVGKFVRFAI
ncbi:MAG: Elongation factor Ts [Parcubacteria group bacterium GW2011_GWC1_45_9]|nr:MAG: Elongation factor Ts [Parcubacteria group bacterium GW2011_GWA1_Parcubacteria_45_10]KKT88491.1 MAG: Elongation factor Ts [Parcubacteria group bacterium GW2011_GWB1_45_10]KKU17252.1 MAG: Elongation factor Ts [Parcubacteria group bacterium GW2011_GWC1_45_9]HCI05721.1 elongation factor Ts [Patescibacteria group bacterium]